MTAAEYSDAVCVTVWLPLDVGSQLELEILAQHYKCEFAFADIGSGQVAVYGGEQLFLKRYYMLFSGAFSLLHGTDSSSDTTTPTVLIHTGSDTDTSTY